MKRYESSTPRAALGLAAAAMTAITIGAMVVLPAKIESVNAEPFALAAVDGAARASIEAAIVPASVDILEIVEGEELRPVAQLSNTKTCAANLRN